MSHQLFRVSYFNRDLCKWCVLVDSVDSAVAQSVAAKFGDPKLPMYYMGKVRIDDMPAAPEVAQ